MSDNPSPSPPPLTLLHTLPHPGTGSTRSWQSLPHPDPSIPLLATASADKSVNVYSLRDFSLVSTITGGHKRSVRTVAWKDFGGHTNLSQRRDAWEKKKKSSQKHPVVLGTGSFDANVGVWVWNDEKRRRLLPRDELDSTHLEEGIDNVPTEPDEVDMTHSAADDDDEDWHFSTLLTGPDSEIKSIEFSPPHYPANLLATSSRDKSVWIWEEVEPEEWETIAVLSEHTGDVKCVGWCAGAVRRSGKKRKGEGEGDVEMGNGEDEEDDEDEIIGARSLLASGSYDDTIRLWRDVEEEGDWICVAVITSHAGTVWDVKWEGYVNYNLLHIPSTSSPDEALSIARAFENDWCPRILSCSDDLTVRTWRRELSAQEKEKRRQQNGAQATSGAPMGFASSRIPSVIRPMSAMEKWVEDATLPAVHVRSVYAVDWSSRTGLVVSCGGDGTIAVYKEIPLPAAGVGQVKEKVERKDDAVMNGTAASSTEEGDAELYAINPSKWEVAVLLEGAHDEYEINHVCWAERRDKERRFEGEEMIVSTGDEGDVRIWILPEEMVRELDDRV